MIEDTASGFDLTINPKESWGLAGLYKIHISNNSYSPTTYIIKARDQDEVCVFAFDNETIKVKPGKTKWFYIQVKPQKELLSGLTQTIIFEVSVTAQNDEGDVTKIVTGKLEYISSKNANKYIAISDREDRIISSLIVSLIIGSVGALIGGYIGMTAPGSVNTNSSLIDDIRRFTLPTGAISGFVSCLSLSILYLRFIAKKGWQSGKRFGPLFGGLAGALSGFITGVMWSVGESAHGYGGGVWGFIFTGVFGAFVGIVLGLVIAVLLGVLFGPFLIANLVKDKETSPE